MTANPRMEPIRELLDASSDDEQTLTWPVPTRVFGFHGQQAVEKLLKVLILASGSNHEYIHDIEVLSTAVVTRGEIIPAVPFPLADLTDFAVIARYTASRDLTPTERDQIRESVRILREHVQARLEILDA